MNKLNLNNGIKFSCQSSGNCCVSRGNHGYVYLSKDDLNKLAKRERQTITESPKYPASFLKPCRYPFQKNIQGQK